MAKIGLLEKTKNLRTVIIRSLPTGQLDLETYAENAHILNEKPFGKDQPTSTFSKRIYFAKAKVKMICSILLRQVCDK